MVTRTIYLIRHGTTEWMEQGVVHGSSESPLSEFGQWEAQQTALALANCNIAHMYSSPQSRALQTAMIIASQLPDVAIKQLDGLREMDFGKMEGKRDFFKKSKRNPLLLVLVSPIWFMCLKSTGEKPADMQARVKTAWERILEDEHPGNIIVVAHSLSINHILALIPFGTSEKKRKRYLLNPCNISTVEVEEGQAVLKEVNNTAHLEKEFLHEH